MPISEPILSAVTEAIFKYALEQNGSGTEEHKVFDSISVPTAVKHALTKSLREFEQQHPQWLASLLNIISSEKGGILPGSVYPTKRLKIGESD